MYVRCTVWYVRCVQCCTAAAVSYNPHRSIDLYHLLYSYVCFYATVYVWQISGVDAARTLLADLLSCTAAGKGVGELALYWAARAKLEEVRRAFKPPKSVFHKPFLCFWCDIANGTRLVLELYQIQTAYTRLLKRLPSLWLHLTNI